jgi:hypothetical protein
MFGNYEANTGYFPLMWQPGKSPFSNNWKNEGFESTPPSADILGNKGITGKYIDYVALLCLDQEYLKHPYTLDIFSQLDSVYKLTYISPNRRIQLYKCRY